MLLLDEPTSGLDAAAALSVMELLQRLTQAQFSLAGTDSHMCLGIGVVAVIHQPR